MTNTEKKVAQFQVELKQLLEKFNCSIELEEIRTCAYGFSDHTIIASFPGEWTVDGIVISDFTEVDLGKYIDKL